MEGPPTRSVSDPPVSVLLIGGFLGGVLLLGGLASGGRSPWQWVAAVPLGAVLGYLAVFDAYTHRLPNRVQYPTLLVSMTYLALAATFGEPVFAAAAWAGGTAVLFLLLSAGGLGMGDVKLAVLLALWTGWLGRAAPLVWLATAFFTAGAVALVLLVARRARASSRIAFGPYLVVGAIVATWWNPL